MTEELDFSNPIKWMERPTPRRWRYIMGALAVLLLIILILLPLLFSSRIGRNMVKMRLESAYRAQVWITSLKTSWFGGTTIEQFSMTDSEGRQIKFSSLKTSMSLWGLLMGHMSLGEARVANLHMDYVVDYGDGSDTFDRLPQGWSPGTTLLPRGPRKAGALPPLSGHIVLSNATLVLTRGDVLEEQQLRTAYRSARLSDIDGEINIPRGLDQPSTCKLAGLIADVEKPGSFDLKASFTLGENGKWLPQRARADVFFLAADVPNRATDQVAPLAWVLSPVLPPEDYVSLFGATLPKMELSLKAADSVIRFDNLEFLGQTYAGQPTGLWGKPFLNLAANSTALQIQSPLLARFRMTRAAAARLAFINPFLQEAAGNGAGLVELTFDELALPLSGGRRNMVARGSVRVSDATLASGVVGTMDMMPRELLTQWQALVGDTSAAIKLNMAPAAFQIENATVACDRCDMTLNGLPVAISGTSPFIGQVQMIATLALPPAMQTAAASQTLSLRITGPSNQPRFNLVSEDGTNLLPKPASRVLDQNLSLLRERRNDELLLLSERQVQGMVRDVERANQRQNPTTQP